MLNSNIKSLLNDVVLLYSKGAITQTIIDQGVEKLKQTKELLQQESVDTETKEMYYYNFRNTLNNVYCEEDGYFPAIYRDVYLSLNTKLNTGTFYFTDDNLYICTVSGQTPENGELPTSTEKGVSFEFGTAKLLWCAKRGKLRLEEVK